MTVRPSRLDKRDGRRCQMRSSDIADQLGLKGQISKMRARSAWEDSELVCETEILNIELSNFDGDKYNLSARKINKLNLPVQKISNLDLSNYFKINNDIKLCQCNIKPKLLIGQDNHHLIAPISFIRCEEREPYVTKTPLGWSVHGASVSTHSNNLPADRFMPTSTFSKKQCEYDHISYESVFHLFTIESYDSSLVPTVGDVKDKAKCTCIQLHDEVRNFFSFECLGVSLNSRQNPNDLRAMSILDKTSKLINGQWTVGLPWKNDHDLMPDSYNNAFNIIIG